MKRLLFLALVLVSTAGFSQGFQFGVKGGVNVSNYTGGDLENSALVGFHGGATLGFLLGDHFAIQPEVLFSAQGAKIEGIGSNKEKFKVSYLNVPVLAKFRFTGGFYLEAGPQVGFKLDENIPDNTIENFAKDLDLSLAAGLGYHSPIGLGFGARYIAGLSKVGDFDPNTADPDFKNSTLQFFVFYTLFNNKK
ncbi:MAG TPA: porin family protein [Flavitalea sp.]|nr:porin family protein [Flavitalea sp.]HTF30321.1 porin family protein [Flavitalea sp.]